MSRSRGISAPLLSLLALSILTVACREEKKPAPPPPEVGISCAEARDVPVALEFVGQTKGAIDVDIRARVQGFLESVNYKEGSEVKKGDLLYTIDPKPFEATLAQARAAEAQAQAMLGRYQQDAARFKPLAEARAIPQRDYDVAVANVAAAEANVASAAAQVRNAEIDLGYTRITSPIDGLAGMTQVQVGNLVGRDQSTLLTGVSQIDPIAVRFSISEADYLRLRRELDARSAEGQEGASGAQAAEIQITLADGSVYPQPGRVNMAERIVDAKTGTLMLEARFPNPDLLIRPGQFVRVRAITGMQKGAVVIPQRAVQEMQGRYSVAVIGPENKVVFRPVDPGEKTGSDWVIRSGLAAGECFVTEGLQRIRDGMVVSPRAAGEGAPGASGAGEGKPGEGAHGGAASGKPGEGGSGGKGEGKAEEGHGN